MYCALHTVWRKWSINYQRTSFFPGTNYNMHLYVSLWQVNVLCVNQNHKSKWAVLQSIRLCTAVHIQDAFFVVVFVGLKWLRALLWNRSCIYTFCDVKQLLRKNFSKRVYWGTWSGGKCWTGWYWRSFPAVVILWFYEHGVISFLKAVSNYSPEWFE